VKTLERSYISDRIGQRAEVTTREKLTVCDEETAAQGTSNEITSLAALLDPRLSPESRNSQIPFARPYRRSSYMRR
jgi:hypothetical protein